MALVLVAVALAAAIHLDWHLARSSHHGALSGGWPLHWLLALPAFALVAWYAHRVWSPKAFRAGLAVIALAAFLAQVLEPLWELSTGATLEWTFGGERLGAAFRYLGVGILSYVTVLGWLRARTP